MMMRVKLVTVSMIAGASESTVRAKRISRSNETFSGSGLPPDMVRENSGNVGPAAFAGFGSRMTARKRQNTARKQGLILGRIFSVPNGAHDGFKVNIPSPSGIAGLVRGSLSRPSIVCFMIFQFRYQGYLVVRDPQQ